MSSESGKPALRASDADREAAVEKLRAAALEGRLDNDELEHRLEAAYSARTYAELAELTGDITPPLVFLRPGSRVNTLSVVSLVAGFLWLGWLGSLAARLPAADRRAVTIEGGMQNSGLALGIIAAQFNSDLAMVAVAGLWGIWHIVSGGSLALLWRRSSA